MSRVIIAVILTAIMIPSFISHTFWMFVLIFAFLYTTIISALILPFLVALKLSKWWHSTLAGVIAAYPVAAMPSSGVDEPRLFVFYIILGMVAGFMIWVLGIFKNPKFMCKNEKLPKSIVIAPILFIISFSYLDALKSRNIYGCVIEHLDIEETTKSDDSVMTIVTQDGHHITDRVRLKKPFHDLNGFCVAGSIRKKANLKDYRFNYHTTSSRSCADNCNKKEVTR